MHSKRREKVERHFARHGDMTVFVGRFMPGFRSIVFAFAGLSKMSYFRFLLIDGIAAGISVPFFIFLGWRFAGQIDYFLASLERIKHILLPIVIGGIVAAGLIYYLRRKKAAERALEAAGRMQV
jgi:membrane protein DedA with SNARE-associated domain